MFGGGSDIPLISRGSLAIVHVHVSLFLPMHQPAAFPRLRRRVPRGDAVGSEAF